MLRTVASNSRPRLPTLTQWLHISQKYSTFGPHNTSSKYTPHLPRRSNHPSQYRQHQQQHPTHPVPTIPHPTTESEIIPYFESQVLPWSAHQSTLTRLQQFGLPHSHVVKLLRLFVEAVKAGDLSTPRNTQFYQLVRFTLPRSDPGYHSMIYTSVFFWWAAHRSSQAFLLENSIPGQTLEVIKTLVRATDKSFPADDYPQARMKHRKIIMHVGPTNSGKTHHALRALAAAPSGVYAGPLRLLAHEVWERLNTGQIVPLGVDLPKRIDGKPALSGSIKGDERYKRLCNMITGEDQKLMGADVNLLSCTIEMLNHGRFVDVAVVDEIQMIADENRGSAWVGAVLGIDAREIHLCGEETAVPIVKQLLKHTGDEVVVHHYERLTPLRVEEESLEGDLSKVQKGDCIVTFSRSNIFRMKKLVEEQTGMRCAVVYGRLPPEVRSEQAALFNDPESGYDVLIGSDAIGMGLNLKIKRVIFETLSKIDSETKTMRPLPVSSTKQIAGRAGRFGLHGSSSEDAGGGATTLYPKDLEYLRSCVAQPYTPLPYATISLRPPDILRIANAIPSPASSPSSSSSSKYLTPSSPSAPSPSISTILSLPAYIGRFPLGTLYRSTAESYAVTSYIDTRWSEMSLSDKALLINAPVPWRDRECVDVVRGMLGGHEKAMRVQWEDVVKGSDGGVGKGGYMGVLESIEGLVEREAQSQSSSSLSPISKSKFSKRTIQNTLSALETFHKIIVFYLWMSFRHPIVYADFEEVGRVKERVEKVLNWCLEKSSEGDSRARISNPRASALDGEKGVVDETTTTATAKVGPGANRKLQYLTRTEARGMKRSNLVAKQEASNLESQSAGVHEDESVYEPSVDKWVDVNAKVRYARVTG
ncbi:P-loop containing nucleoside triphosphate hydrolase protein [Crepidotus variabilis]|uniref:P-loop containing nucleoside triphosphate hydrolase protein n=1 Tax=Crepidotus variabilis TaxID=179855 RepID=A0A9P6JP81_9AGAR|nr:P-loop containing nucleoside triphosphate hydrolase protein [Crepidotus variabilis]